MNRIALLLTGAVAMGLAGCVSTASGPTAATSTAAFVPAATVSNTFEIETSRVAERRARSPQVRRFARQMIQDHTMAARRMMAVTQSAGLPAQPAALDAAHQAMLERLTAASPAEFDALYMQMQAQAHQEAVTLFTAYAQGGDNPTLVAFARETLPTLEQHAQNVQAITTAAR